MLSIVSVKFTVVLVICIKHTVVAGSGIAMRLQAKHYRFYFYSLLTLVNCKKIIVFCVFLRRFSFFMAYKLQKELFTVRSQTVQYVRRLKEVYKLLIYYSSKISPNIHLWVILRFLPLCKSD